LPNQSNQFHSNPSTSTATFCTIQNKNILPPGRRHVRDTTLATQVTPTAPKLAKPLAALRLPLKAVKKMIGSRRPLKERWIVRKPKK
jgi:hypothetical protein